MKLSIIIVNYNASHFINQTINSILKSNLNIEYEIVIVDNNSYDDSVELIKAEYPNLKIILNDKNLGFSKAVNIGVNSSFGDSILLLNPDTIVEPNSIQNLYNSLHRDTNIGVVGPKVIDPDGKFQLSSRRAYPSFLTSLFQV